MVFTAKPPSHIAVIVALASLVSHPNTAPLWAGGLVCQGVCSLGMAVEWARAEWGSPEASPVAGATLVPWSLRTDLDLQRSSVWLVPSYHLLIGNLHLLLPLDSPKGYSFPQSPSSLFQPNGINRPVVREP